MPRHTESLQPWLGKAVEVILDRPRGSAHPDWPDLVYPIDYGYIPNTIGGDNSPIDVYLVDGYFGHEDCETRVIGAVDRLDDVEFKLIASRDNIYRSVTDIFEAVSFVEKYFDVEIVTCCDTKSFRRGTPLAP